MAGEKVYTERVNPKLDCQALLLHSGISFFARQKLPAEECHRVIIAVVVTLAKNSTNTAIRGVRLQYERLLVIWTPEYG